MVCNFTQKDETMRILDAGLSDLFSELEGAKNEKPLAPPGVSWFQVRWIQVRWAATLRNDKKCVQTNF